jgi:starch phosphorylase
LELVDAVLPPREFASDLDWRTVICRDGRLNMTFLALSLSHYINGVAKRHAEVSQLLYARYKIDAITNGIHAATWVCPQMATLFDRVIPDWRRDNFSLRYALSLPRQEMWEAHRQAKMALLNAVRERTNVVMDPQALTIGFGRRATAYKRADLVFQDPGRLRQMVKAAGPIQFVFAGKAHPRDEAGKQLIRHIIAVAAELRETVPVVYVPDYDITLGKLMTAGVDVWLNTPMPPMEASGTSGMKAAVNGVPSLSVLDGWWIEGCIEGVTGWSVGQDGAAVGQQVDHSNDAARLYDKLEQRVLPTYYGNREHFMDMMLHCIALNGSFFNTHRMVLQYVLKAYFG